MKCDRFRNDIELGLNAGDFELSPDLKAHLDVCRACASYFSTLKAIKSTLDSQVFEVLPGELDSVTLDNVIKSDSRLDIRPRLSEILFKGFKKWAWAPVAAAAVILLLLRLPGMIDRSTESISLSSQTASSEDWDMINTAADSGLWSYVVGSLMDDGQDLDLVAEELSHDVDFDDELSNLNDEELQYLYNNIDELRGDT